MEKDVVKLQLGINPYALCATARGTSVDRLVINSIRQCNRGANERRKKNKISTHACKVHSNHRYDDKEFLGRFKGVLPPVNVLLRS